MTFVFFFSEILINLLIIITSIFFLFKIKFLKFINFNTSLFIYFYHTLFMIVMIVYGYYNPGDSNFYWKNVDKYEFEIFIGSNFMKLFLFYLKNYIHLSYSNLLLLLNFIGSLGILFFLDYIKHKYKKKDIFPVFFIILLPSLHLWTNTFIKETFILTLIFIFIWLNNKTKYFNLKLLIFFLTFLLRPYLGIILLFPFLITEFQKSNNKTIALIPLVCIMISVFLSFIFFLKIHSIDFVNLNLLHLFDTIIEKYKQLGHGSSYVSTDKFFLLNMASYIFSPVFFINYINGPMQIFFFLESLFLIYILFILLRNFDFHLSLEKSLYLLMVSLLLFIVAETTTNLGIILRQKWTILIFYIYILIDGQKKQS